MLFFSHMSAAGGRAAFLRLLFVCFLLLFGARALVYLYNQSIPCVFSFSFLVVFSRKTRG